MQIQDKPNTESLGCPRNLPNRPERRILDVKISLKVGPNTSYK